MEGYKLRMFNNRVLWKSLGSQSERESNNEEEKSCIMKSFLVAFLKNNYDNELKAYETRNMCNMHEEEKKHMHKRL